MFKPQDPVVGIKTPMDFKYLRIVRFTLRILCGWPGKELGERTYWFERKEYAYYNTSLSVTYLISGIMYLKRHIPELSFFEMGHMLIVLLMNILATSRAVTLSLPKQYRILAKQFIQEIQLFHHKDKSEYAMEIHKKVHYFSHYFAIYLTTMMFIALALFNLTPVTNNFLTGKYKSRENLINRTYEHSVYLVYPFNSDSNFNGYIVASAINWYGSYLCASSVCVFDLFLSLMIFNLWGHFKILLHRMETFPLPAALERTNINDGEMVPSSEKYTDEEQKMVAQQLRECVDYHRLIVQFTNSMSESFGLALFINYMFHQVSGCLLLLECSQLNPQALAVYVPLSVLMFQQLIQLSIIFETIGAMSEKLKDAVYSLPWEYMDSGNRKTVFIFLINVQEPIHVTAAGIVSVGVRTMASILKASFSYFTFLRTATI